MKIGFIADIHIKLGQKSVPVEWAKNRYELFFNEIKQMEPNVDRWVIGGDIFDKVPSMEEMEVFFSFVACFSKPTLMFSGNHESVKKNTTFLSHLKQAVSRLNKNVVVIDDYYSDEVLDILPYNKLKEYAPVDINSHNKILCTHVRGEIPPHVKPEVDLSMFKRWDVVLAGDLHSYANSQLNILYPGSPMTTSFHRNLVETGAIILDADTLKHEFVVFGLPQLIRKTIKVGEDMPASDYHHVIYEVEGDMAELAELENSALLDKKVVKRDVDTALILDPELSLSEEVEEYLRYVLNLNEDAVVAVLTELNNHIGKLDD